MKPKPRTHWNSQRFGHTTLSLRPRPRPAYTVLRVAGIVDTGRGGAHNIVLKNALPWFLEADLPASYAVQDKARVPRQIDGLNCIYTGRGFGMIADVTETLKAVTGRARLAAVVPDVMMTGDFILFRHSAKGMKFAGILRAIPESKYKGLQCSTTS